MRSSAVNVSETVDCERPSDRAARVHDVEQMTGLQHVVVGWQHELFAFATAGFQDARNLTLHVLELALEDVHVGDLKLEGRELLLVG